MNTPFDVNTVETFRRTRREKMQEIIPGLWLGSQEALHDEGLLEKCGITHILSATPTLTKESGVVTTSLSPPTLRFCNSKGICRMIIPVQDEPSENLLQYFPRSTEFILGALCNSGRVLVHCLAGASRSPTFVAAFLMEVYKLSPAEAIAKIRESRRLVRPILGFYDQLMVYEACNYRPSNQPVYLHWHLRAQCETEIESPETTTISKCPKVLAKIPGNIQYVVAEMSRLACATCSKVLAPMQSLLPFNNAEDDHYLAQPIDWMSPEFDNREHEGNLACPECETVVGEYNWNGRRNIREQWVTPAFVLYRRSVVKVC